MRPSAGRPESPLAKRVLRSFSFEYSCQATAGKYLAIHFPQQRLSVKADVGAECLLKREHLEYVSVRSMGRRRQWPAMGSSTQQPFSKAELRRQRTIKLPRRQFAYMRRNACGQ